MFEFFRDLEKEAFLFPSQEEVEKVKEEVRKQVPYETFREKAIAEGKDPSEEAYESFVEEMARYMIDPFRLVHEGSSFTVHKENIPFLLRKELVYRQREGKAPIFGCRIKLWIDGFMEEKDGEKVFYPTGGKEKVEVLEVLGAEETASLMEEEKLTYGELMDMVRGFGSNADMIFHLVLPGNLKETMLRDRFFLECQNEEELTRTLELICSPSFTEEIDEVVWELILIAQEDRVLVRFEGAEKVKIGEAW